MRIKLLILALLFLLFGVRFVFADSVVLNELMPHPSPGSDWIEIYNPTNQDVDISNWTLMDSTSKMKTLSGIITDNGFVTFDVTNRLNNSGDNIYLKDASGTTIDNYSYNSDPGINISFGRSPDGGSWTVLASSSKGASNGEPSPTPTPTPSPTPSPSPTPVSTPSNTPSPKLKTTSTTSKTPTPTVTPTTPPPLDTIPTPKPPKPKPKVNYSIASVAAVTTSATPAAKVEIKSQKQTNYLVWAGIILVFAGTFSIGYIYLRKNASIHIKFRKRD